MAHHTSQLLDQLPVGETIDHNALQACIDECRNCAEECRRCAAACEAEPNAAELLHCIRFNLDCADICEATADVLKRRGEPDTAIIQAQVMAALIATQACGAECEFHAEHGMEHFRVCPQACLSCATACQQVIDHLHA